MEWSGLGSGGEWGGVEWRGNAVMGFFFLFLSPVDAPLCWGNGGGGEEEHRGRRRER